MAKKQTKKEKFELEKMQKALEENLAKAKKEVEEYNQNLRDKSKNADELITSIDCIIESVLGQSQQITHTPQSEVRYGGQSPSYRTGDTYHSEIDVKTKTNVKKIYFNGWPPLQAGDQIRAYILKGKEEYEKSEFGLELPEWFFNRNHKKPTHWIEREFEDTETAVKIEKLVNNKVVATYLN